MATGNETTPRDIAIRSAIREDLPAIIAMLANDHLGSKRERYADPLPDVYYSAFEAIDSDPNNEIVVAELDGKIIGTMQLTLIPNLTYQGGIRALIEGVRVDSTMRSAGIGRILFEWAIEQAKQRGCHMVQLTADKTRPDAHRFYESLGFSATHEGMKLHLT